MIPPAGAVLLDIEGTTSPVTFVYDVLFPYARRHVGAFLSRHQASPDVAADIRALRLEHERDTAEGRRPPAWPSQAEAEGAAAYALWLMDQDRKATPLKSLQGKIWEAGYAAGELKGEVYPDVPRAFRAWRGDGRTIAIFSSGSVLAQKLLFGHSTAGDLSPYIAAYFDTTTGAKREAESYRAIARHLDRAAEGVLFVSDVGEELDAARAAGMRTALCVREGPLPAASPHEVVRTLDGI